MALKASSQAADRIAQHIEYGESDQLTAEEQEIEIRLRGIDPSTAKPKSSSVKLLLRDDRPGKRAAIAHNASSHVKIIALPPEVRNMIYALVVEAYATLPPQYKQWGICWAACPSEPALVKTCNFLRRDMIPVWYGNRTVGFSATTPADRTFAPADLPLSTVITQYRTWAAKTGSERLNAAGTIIVKLGNVKLEIRGGECNIVGMSMTGDSAVRDDIMQILDVVTEYLDRFLRFARTDGTQYMGRRLELEGRQ